MEKAAEAEKQRKLKELENDKMNAKMIERLFMLREATRKVENGYRDLKDYFTGEDSAQEEVNETRHLIMAAKGGHINKLIDLLEHPYMPIAPDACTEDDGKTAMYNTLTMILNNENTDDGGNEFLLDNGCFASFKRRWTRYFQSTAKAAKLDLVVKILMYKGASVNSVVIEKDPNVDGIGPLHVAAQRGANSYILWMVTTLKVDINLKTYRFRKTPLMFSALEDMIDTALVLLRNGCMSEINHQDINGWSALHYAAVYASPEFVQVLLMCGADMNCRNDRLKSPKDEAESRGRVANGEVFRVYKEKVSIQTRKMRFMQKMYLPDVVTIHDDMIDDTE